MQTAILVEAGNQEPICLRVNDLDNYINRAPLNNEQDRTYKAFKRVHIIEEAGKPDIGIYAHQSVKDADAKAIGLKEADKFLHPEKYKKEHNELQSLREENARLRSELAASAIK